ncbi:MAG TPA: hypothetical protein VGJ14_16635 [Sporichthyaceae bacterium]|jgi:hypothetical protein
MKRLPSTLAGGRIRTSTVLLLIAFLGVLTLWVSVRPTTEEQVEQVAVRHKTTHRTVTRTIRPTPTPTPSAVSTAPPAKGGPAEVPAPLPVAPAPTTTPGQTGPPAGSISHVLAPGHSAPAATPPPDGSTPAPPPPAPNAQPAP